ncbi:MAG: anthranilate phosphoribosyltransferase [Candidatus Omnitrophica bacterium]|nr:anthranilate phosphoribosyltransferase [Candidatus Omnitrophota bacterium]
MKLDLANLLTGGHLSKAQAESVFRQMVQGKLSEEFSKTLLLLLAKRGESIQEIEGCLKIIRQLEPPRYSGILHLMDTCGTGGDQSRTINVSTLAAFVIAGAGGKVAKHGNRSLSSQCGSSDLVEALGVNLAASPEKMIRAIKKHGIGFFHAPLYHPIFKSLQPLRKKLKTRTIFNYLGPLVNPLALDYQLVGVSRQRDVSTYAEILRKSKIRRAIVCSSADGLDEISTSAPCHIARIQQGQIHRETWNPAQFGFKKASRKSLQGGSIKKNRDLAVRILTGKLYGPMRDTVLLNSAAGLYAAGIAKNLKQGIRLATDSIDSGRAYQALRGLKKISRGG